MAEYAKAGADLVEGRYEIPVDEDSKLETGLSLFESGWADYQGEHIDWPLWRSSHMYRGGWLASASSNMKQSTG